MLKWPFNRILQLRIGTCVCAVLCLIAIIQLIGSCGHYNYYHIAMDDIPGELYRVPNTNLVQKKSLPDCNYDEILKRTESIAPDDVPLKYQNFSPEGIDNGTFVPEHCNPQISVAILVTYRNRKTQLDIFLPYMHNFLRRQNIHYKMFVIEQQDDNLWNKGVLYNVGARLAMAERFPCLVLHDVDLLPLSAANLYACTRRPRHLSASIDKFRYVLTFYTLVGGVFAVRSDHFLEINGFSNRFEAWGGEDDDFGARLGARGLAVVRLPSGVARYTMLLHRPEPKSGVRLQVLAENRRRSPRDDGFSTAHYHYRHLAIAHHQLYTLLTVQL